MSRDKTLAQYLKQQGYESATPEVLRVFKALEDLPAPLHAIPAEVQQEKADYLALVGHLEHAVEAAKRIESRLPPACGLNMGTPEQQWRQGLITMLEAVRAQVPQPKGGRPRNIGEEKQALAVMGALLRHGVPEQRISAVTTECLNLLGMAEESMERAVRAARSLTKPTTK